jgi:hypothetical protein
MKNIIASLLLLSALSMSRLSFGMDEAKSEEVSLKEFFQTVAPRLFAQVKMVRENADADYKVGFKQFLQNRLTTTEEDEVCDLASAASYSKAVWKGQSGIDRDPHLNDQSKRAIMAAYALATGAMMEALKCLSAGCYVASETKFDFATVYGLEKVTREEYRENLRSKSKESWWPTFQAGGSRALAKILLAELGEENK